VESADDPRLRQTSDRSDLARLGPWKGKKSSNSGTVTSFSLQNNDVDSKLSCIRLFRMFNHGFNFPWKVGGGR
jgi:hypothetical protein